MKDLVLASRDHARPPAVSARDVLDIGIRRGREIVATFLAIVSVTLLAAFVWPWPYRAEMKILVKQDRVDPLVSSENAERAMVFPGVAEQDLNSEVELIKSRDLLERVVLATGLANQPDSWRTRLKAWLTNASPQDDPALKVARATLALQEGLSVEPIQKTSLIRVSFGSRDAPSSARVLHSLAELYLAKHVEVHRPPGVLDFFEQEVDRYRDQLDTAKGRLAAFGQSEGVVSAGVERDAALQQVADLTQRLNEVESDLAATQQRIGILETQRAGTPPRITTESREAHARLQEVQRSKLLELELKRIELARVFQPDYPAVVEVNQQLAAAREAISQAEHAPIREEATGVNPAHEWLTTELAKTRSEAGALRSRRATLSAQLELTRARALTLDRLAMESHELERDLKTAEENYVTYNRKRDEARISNALDTRRIVNVAVADAATVPLKTTRPPAVLILALAFGLGILGSVGLALIAELVDPSFRSADDVVVTLHVPVLASYSPDRGLVAGYFPPQAPSRSHE